MSENQFPLLAYSKEQHTERNEANMGHYGFLSLIMNVSSRGQIENDESMKKLSH